MYVPMRMCVCVYVCMYVRMYVCMYVCMNECMNVCMYGCMYVCVYYVCMYTHNIWMYVCTYVYMSYMYVHVSLCVCVCVHRDDTNFASPVRLTNNYSCNILLPYFCIYKPAARWDKRYIRSNGEQKSRHSEKLGVHGQILSGERWRMSESKLNPSDPEWETVASSYKDRSPHPGPTKREISSTAEGAATSTSKLYSIHLIMCCVFKIQSYKLVFKNIIKLQLPHLNTWLWLDRHECTESTLWVHTTPVTCPRSGRFQASFKMVYH